MQQKELRHTIESLAETSSETTVVTEESMKQLLSEHGICTPRQAFVTNEAEALRSALELGFPLVAKIISAQILHKTELKAVKVGLSSDADIRKFFAENHSQLSKQFNVKGVLLEELISPGVELIIGLQNDSHFGPVIMVGSGGVYTEIIRDVQFRVLPITKQDVLNMIGNLRWRQVLSGYRGCDPINLDILVDAILKIANLGIQLQDYYESIELNPLIVNSSGYCVVDAKMLLRKIPERKTLSDERNMPPNLAHLDLFFNATSIAVIGASPYFGNVGTSILNKLGHGNSGKRRIFPISTEPYDEIGGIKAYKRIDDIKEKIDLVIAACDLKLLKGMMDSIGRKGIHNIVILSGGGKEMGGEHANTEQQINSLAQKYNIRIVGPNCIGLFSSRNELDYVFQGYGKGVRKPPRGNVAFVSQSGTFGAAFMESASDTLGVSKLITYGNRSNVDEADLLWYLANDDDTKVIGMYFEGLDDGRKFIETAKRVISEKEKPIVVFKNNRTSHAAKQSALHNGSLASSYEVTKGAFDQCGIISVNNYEELLGSLKALSFQPIPTGNRIAMVTNGGGAVVAALDYIENLGLRIAPLEAHTKTLLREYFPATYAVGNPSDLTCVATISDYKFAIEKLLQDPNVDMVIVWFVPWFVLQDSDRIQEDSIVKFLASLKREQKKPILVGTFSETFSKCITKRIEKIGIPVYHSVSTMMTAASNQVKWSKSINSLVYQYEYKEKSPSHRS